eukprot:comp19491_c0_seq3/m.37043 comp19491_c0_seq3/g.37043  ORF comp19491_c0_seq3/g.37043 comp19491_c0_seq3/m.37043 type:complete len:161 (+) comp19491_c0_seq3:101-583(+)
MDQHREKKTQKLNHNKIQRQIHKITILCRKTLKKMLQFLCKIHRKFHRKMRKIQCKIHHKMHKIQCRSKIRRKVGKVNQLLKVGRILHKIPRQSQIRLLLYRRFRILCQIRKKTMFSQRKKTLIIRKTKRKTKKIMKMKMKCRQMMEKDGLRGKTSMNCF